MQTANVTMSVTSRQVAAQLVKAVDSNRLHKFFTTVPISLPPAHLFMNQVLRTLW